MLNRKECQLSIRKWQSSKGNINEILRVFPSNFIFKVTEESIKWVLKNNNNECFVVKMGIHDDKAIVIFYPLDPSGQEKDLKEFPISFLGPLESDIKFVEQEVRTQTKVAVLSCDLKVISRVVEESQPLYQHQIECQDTILEQVEDWRNESADWFFKQIKETKGESIFNLFHVPIEDLEDGSRDIIGLFALKYSKIYSEVLPTIIFVHHEGAVLGNSKLHSIQTNLYNWSQPCPPFCKPKGG